MPAGIAQRQIGGRAGLGRRQIGARYALSDYPVPYFYPAGNWIFTVPFSGKWRIVLWGAGGSSAASTSSGASGALYIGERRLRAGQTVALAISKADAGVTTATLPSGEVLSAGSANFAVAGTATANQAGDTAIAGTAGGGDGTAGANAPSSGTFQGGQGGAAGVNDGTSPGAGGGVNGTNIGRPGHGLAILARSRD